jgi:Uma2 family endonuclease
VSPVDVYFDELLSAVQPHVLFISNENQGILKNDGYVHGAPDLVIEVTSGNFKRDRVMKKGLYEKAGVKEYFIVNPRDRKVDCFVLNNRKYSLVYSGEGKFSSALLNLHFSF